MSCIEAVGRILGNIPQASGTITGVTCLVAGNVRGTTIKASGSIVCAIGSEAVIRFTLSGLRWNGADNNAGVTKYNTLISSGEWSLEEVEIEELL